MQTLGFSPVPTQCPWDSRSFQSPSLPPSPSLSGELSSASWPLGPTFPPSWVSDCELGVYLAGGYLADISLLGFFESSITAALIIFTGQWYKSSEQGIRTGLWASMTAVGAATGGLLSWSLSVGDLHKTLTVPGWKVLFIILGCFTSLIGLLWSLIVPDKPETAWWLTRAQKQAMPARLAGNHNNVRQDVGFKKYQIIEALTDPLIYLYLFTTAICCLPTGGFTNFFAILIQGMGFNTQQTLLLGIGNAWLGFWIAGMLYLGDKFRRRCAMAYFPLVVSTVGVVMVWALPHHMKVARVMGYFLAMPFAVPQIIILSLIVTNVAGRTKKTIVNGFYLCFLCAGNLAAPQIFRQKDAPNFTPALISTVVCNLTVMCLMTVIWMLYRRENKRRDAIIAEKKANGTWDENEDLGQDLTDRENIHFRYTV